MLTDEKKKEIRKLLKKGIPEGELKEQLINEGFSNEDINSVFAPVPYDMRSWYLISGIIIFLIGIYLFISNRGSLVMILSAGLFVQYIREKKRVYKKV